MLFGFHIIAAYCQCYVRSFEFVNHKKSLPLVTGCFLFLPEVLQSVVSPCGAALVGSFSSGVVSSWSVVMMSFPLLTSPCGGCFLLCCHHSYYYSS